MQFFTMKKTKAFTLMSTILFLVSIMLTVIPVHAPKPNPPGPIDWNAFQGPYDPAVHGVYPEWDPGSGNIPAVALVYPGLPPGAVPDYEWDTVAYLSVRPNPIGVGQSMLVNCWISPGTYHAFYGPDWKITIEDPTGHQDVRTVDSYYADLTYWFEFAPTIAGTWKIKFEFPGMYLPKAQYEDHPEGHGFFGLSNNTYNLRASIYYKPSATDWQEFTVQDDLVWSWPAMALPTDYWARPINPINREWYSIAGNFPFTTKVYYPNGDELYASNYRYTAYVEAPESAHIVWKRQQDIGGLIGGEEYYQTDTGSSSGPDIIFWGRCYQAITKSLNGEAPTNVWQCYDLRTGEIYWEQKALQTTVPGMFGPQTRTLVPTNIVYEHSTSEAVPGAHASQGTSIYLVGIYGGRLYKWDPWSGALATNVSISPVSTGTIYYNDQVLSVQSMGSGNYRLINWSMRGSTSNFANRILTNITWPLSSLGTCVDYDYGYVVDGWWNNPPGPQWCIGVEFDVVNLYTGQLITHYATNDTLQQNNQAAGQSFVIKHGIFADAVSQRHWTGYDLSTLATTNTYLWTSHPLADYPWGNWWPYATAAYDFNETTSAVITSTYEGVYAIDFADGSVLWHYYSPRSVPFENPYTKEDGSPSSPFFTGVMIADGKVYAYNGEHSASQPYSRDWSLHCINATTGEGIWTIYNEIVPQAVADGYLIATNSYDGYLYVFGKGESATTVTGPKTAVPVGTSLVIEGTVTDQSPAQPGTPCVSKDSMNTQMEYLHLQFPLTGIWGNSTITGVPVVLTAINQETMDVIDIGEVTSNGYYGTFGCVWTPSEEGTYEIIASFNGDESYGSSASSTFVSVGPAPEETQTPEPSPSPEPTHPIISLEAALIIAVVVIAAVVILAWALMRRK